MAARPSGSGGGRRRRPPQSSPRDASPRPGGACSAAAMAAALLAAIAAMIVALAAPLRSGGASAFSAEPAAALARRRRQRPASASARGPPVVPPRAASRSVGRLPLLAKDGDSASSSSTQQKEPPPPPPSKQQSDHEQQQGDEKRATASSTGSPEYRDPDMIAYAAGYSTAFAEVPFRMCEPARELGKASPSSPNPSFGAIPRCLAGTTYYRAGPAMFSAGSIVPPKTSIVQPRQLPVPDGSDPSRMVLHPMEGDGAVLAVTFTTAAAEADEEQNEDVDDPDRPVACAVRYRYVRTPGFTSERKKGQRLYSGMDSTRLMGDRGGDAFLGLANDHPLPLLRHHYQPGLNKLRRHTANARTLYWGGRLFCLWEGGQPYKLDGRALGTEGRSRLGGAVLKDEDPLGGAAALDAARNRLLLYGISHGPQSSDLTLYEFDEAFRLVEPGGRRTFRVPGFLLANGVCATPNYAVLVAPNVQCSAARFLVSKDPGSVLRLGRGGSVLLVPRAGTAGSGDVKVVPIPPDELSEANLQLVNAYEEGGLVVMDVIRSDGSSKGGGGGPSRWPWATTLREYRDLASQKSLWRYTIDPRAGAVSKERLLKGRHVDFAAIDPDRSARRHEHVYMTVGATRGGSSPPQGILKYSASTGSVQEWMPEPHEFCGEPAFAPRCGGGGGGGESRDEDGGYLLSVLFNGRTRESELVVLDASDVGAGPVCRVPLGFAVPHGHHGCHAPRAGWSPGEIARRAKLHDKMESRGNYWNEVKSDFSGLGLRLDDMEEYFGDFFS